MFQSLRVLGGRGLLLRRSFSSSGKELNVNVTYKGRKKFYKEASVVQTPEGFTVALDGRSLKTPQRNALTLPRRGLAEAIAFEWSSQKRTIEPTSMLLMTLACTTIDTTHDRRAFVIEELMRFLDTDTVLFPGHPEESEKGLIRAQKLNWNPLLNWMKETYGSVNVCYDVMIEPHPKATIESVRTELENMNDWELTAIESLAAGCKSIIIPLALYRRHIGVKEAVKASRVEEEHQVNTWGLVEGGHDVDRAHINAQVAAASVFLWLVKN